VKQRHYHVRLLDAELYDALHQMKLVGLGSSRKHSGIRLHYLLHANPDLGA
jgi:hypothetical protein